MTQDIPTELQVRSNQRVLSHLAGVSAHSDVAAALKTALQPLGDVLVFCPDWQAYRYVVAATKGVIFAFAAGMNTIGLRLDERFKGRAIATGGSPCSECGEEWVSFLLFRDDWPEADLEFWARKAYAAARGIKD